MCTHKTKTDLNSQFRAFVCVLLHGAVLHKIPSKELAKMIITNVHHIWRKCLICLLFTNIWTLKAKKMLSFPTLADILSVDTMRPVFWFGHMMMSDLLYTPLGCFPEYTTTSSA